MERSSIVTSSVEAKAQKGGLIELSAKAESTSSGSATLEVVKSKEDEPAFMELAARGPNLALARLRIELEKELRKVAERHALAVDNTRGSLTTLARQRGRAGILTAEQVSVLSDLAVTLNRAVHGADVDSVGRYCRSTAAVRLE